ncbi:MAG: TSCPD domain-containing protein, partial [Firmicutes bacterium]|nr:TSCPD domain-containing protein [Bacillota bacterium]
MNFNYKTTGTCSQQINFTIEDGIISNVEFIGGCNGN